MNQTLLASLLLISSTSSATNLSNPNALVEMMRSMLNMMEMLQFYQNASGGSRLMPGTGAATAFPMQQWNNMNPGLPQLPAAPRMMEQPDKHTEFKAPKIQDIEGSWKNEADITLAVKQRYARMYHTPQQYQNYYIELIPQRLRFTDANSGQVQEFDVSIEGNRLILRDGQGRTTTFQRLSADPVQGNN